MKLAQGGIQLSFDIAGVGPLQFLFVHGLGGDRTHFAPQMEYFARQGRALNAELRGHGESDKPRQVYSIEGFADDLVWLCNRQQIAKPVIVGQSMGGNMALEIAARYPDFPAGLVLLDSGVLFPASAGTVFAEYLEGLRGADFANEARKIVADSVCRPTNAATMLNRPFWRRHSTCSCPRSQVCSPGMSIGRVSAPRPAESRRSISRRPIGSQIWIVLRRCARN